MLTQLASPAWRQPSVPARGRAAPLPPDERRAAILLAVRPVILARGAAVTSRELAEAAGVAEGTLFRVFTDKVTLVREAVLAAVDPADASRRSRRSTGPCRCGTSCCSS